LSPKQQLHKKYPSIPQPIYHHTSKRKKEQKKTRKEEEEEGLQWRVP